MLTAPWNRIGFPKELATEFLGVFARFEFALKASGFFVQPRPGANPGGRVKPDWDRFGAQIGNQYQRNGSPELAAACDYLLHNVPGAQVLNAVPQPIFAPLPLVAAQTDLENLLRCVRTVRNNLFHGGKFAPAQIPNRDLLLVTFSMLVLEAALPLDPAVEHQFHHG